MDIQVLVNQLIMLFIMIFTGFGLNKVGLMGEKVDKKFTDFVLRFTTPLLVLGSVIGGDEKRDVHAVFIVFLLSLGMYIALPILAAICTRIFRTPKDHRGVYQFMFIFGNVGFMGYPIVDALFGGKGVLYTGILNILFNVLAYSYGAHIVAKDSGKNAKFELKTLLTPGISICTLAIIIYFLGIQFPKIIVSPIVSFGSMTTPLAMLLIGSTLANMDLKSVFTDKSIYIFIVVRMLITPLVLFFLVKCIVRDPFLQQFMLIMFCMPVGSASVLFAKQYDSDEEFAAKGVFVSTLLSIVTIPLISFICL